MAEMIKKKRPVVYGVLICMLLICLSGSSAFGGWRIDGERFAQSIHADLSCVECHSDIEALSRHPEPANVRKKMSDFFSADKCLECHDDIQGQIEDDKEHGGETVDSAERFFNCIGCHDPHYEGAPGIVESTEPYEFSQEDALCMVCHQVILKNDEQAVAKNRDFCFTCHGQIEKMVQSVPVMNIEEYAGTPHADLDCMTCHPEADKYEHDLQPVSDCKECHTPHKESIANETHTAVSCQACHLGDIVPERDIKTNDVVWVRTTGSGTVSKLHDLIKPDGKGCLRCHFHGNSIGAASMVLPAKSVLCMPCHTATVSAGDKVSMITLAVFAFGILCFMSLWFSGSFAGEAGTGFFHNMIKAFNFSLKTLFSARLGKILPLIWYDVLLQRKLYMRSPKRWFIHALIFWPFVIRFVWGVIGLIFTNWIESSSLGWMLIDKNHAVSAFVFDLTGICLITGIIMAFFRGSEADKTRNKGLPQQDKLALILIGSIVLVGFILEGMRMAMTGAQDPACWAIIGYLLSKLFVGMEGLTEIYGYIWYLHAILSGLFVAYLPFSKMMHIIMSPIVLAMNAAKDEHH